MQARSNKYIEKCLKVTQRIQKDNGNITWSLSAWDDLYALKNYSIAKIKSAFWWRINLTGHFCARNHYEFKIHINNVKTIKNKSNLISFYFLCNFISWADFRSILKISSSKMRTYLNIGLCKVRNVTGKWKKWVHDYMFLISQCVPYDYASCVSNASSNYSGKIITQ